MANLNTFAMVGLLERHDETIHMVQLLVDPEATKNRLLKVWDVTKVSVC